MTDALGEFAASFNRCWLCGIMAINTWPPRLEIHHIARGPSRSKAREERCALIRSCPRCHQAYLDSMQVTEQLALKLKFDPQGYDRVAVNRLRNRADNAVSEGEVQVSLVELEILCEKNGGYPFPRWVNS